MAPLAFTAIRGFQVGGSALDGLPSLSADESGHSAAYSLSVGNRRDTGHSAEAMPPAALADDPPFGPSALTRY